MINTLTITCRGRDNAGHPTHDRTVCGQLWRRGGDEWSERPRRTSRQRAGLTPERLRWAPGADKESAGQLLRDSETGDARRRWNWVCEHCGEQLTKRHDESVRAALTELAAMGRSEVSIQLLRSVLT